MRTDIIERKDEIVSWVNEHLPNAEIAKRLSCKVETLKRYYSILNIEYSGNQNRRGLKHYEHRASIEQVLASNRNNSTKRKRLIEDGYKEEKMRMLRVE